MIWRISGGFTLLLLMLGSGEDLSSTRAFMAPIWSASTEELATDFTLKDQFDKLQVYRFPRDRVTVLAFGDRKGSEQVESWVKPLYQRYKERVDINGVAVLDTVPSVARGIVRKVIKAQVKHPVMLDWNGLVAKKYDYTGGAASVVVIDRSGKILLRNAGAADEASLNRVYVQIDQLLNK
ncbi:MAG: hypothetical protein WKF84_27350 [Pyrinomonadaceae bacterium]